MVKPTHDGFETAGEPYDQSQDTYALIKQIVADMARDNPAVAVTVRFQGGQFQLIYHAYEMLLGDPKRRDQAEADGQRWLDEALKLLKKEFKSKSGHALGLKELKDRRDSSLQKTSLNERYYMLVWRVYEIHP